MSTLLNKQILLTKRPAEGETVGDQNFTIVEKTMKTSLQKGEVLLKNLYTSVDPAMRSWMVDRKSYIPPVKLGAVMRSACVSEVLATEYHKLNKGDLVLVPNAGWQLFCVLRGKTCTKVQRLPGYEPSVYLGILGMTGLTAYFGLFKKGNPVPGDVVLVSGAAGATGSAVGQLAKLAGCKVYGTAGSAEKCEKLMQMGFDGALNYKDANLRRNLKKMIGKGGIDIYFDNVGGPLLDLALIFMNRFGRIVTCGAISQYDKVTYGLKNYLVLISQRIRMEGFIIFDYETEYKTAMRRMATWLVQGKLRSSETMAYGLENVPSSLNRLFSGKKTGKMVVKLTTDSKI